MYGKKEKRKYTRSFALKVFNNISKDCHIHEPDDTFRKMNLSEILQIMVFELYNDPDIKKILKKNLHRSYTR